MKRRDRERRRRCRLSTKLFFSHFPTLSPGIRNHQIRVTSSLVQKPIFSTVSVSMNSSSSSSSSSPSPSHVQDKESQLVKLLSGKDDNYGGVIVELNEGMDSGMFVSVLKASISHWRDQGKKGVWIKVPIQLVNLVEAAVREGFWYHHAEPNYLMLVYGIPETPHTIPANATHRVSVGALVMTENNEVLVVQEKSGGFQGTGIWKFPTGVADEGEDICVAAVREVKEETGIDAEFVEILSFRQSHKAFFQKSGLFFVCMLRPLSFDIKLQDVEIKAAQWMPFEDFNAQPFNQKDELLKYIADICVAKKEGKYSGFVPVLTTTSFSSQKCYLYLNNESLSRATYNKKHAAHKFFVLMSRCTRCFRSRKMLY